MANKIGILMENRFIEKEIRYYQSRFASEGFEVVLLTRLWGQNQQTYQAIEGNTKITVNQSFENLTDRELEDYAAIIAPAGYVSDYLLYSEVPKKVSPAATFVKKVMQNKAIIKGFICHSLWLATPIKEAFDHRVVTCHNNLIAQVKNAGMTYVDKAIRVDEDLITARTGEDHILLADAIIEKIGKKQDTRKFADSIVLRNTIRKQKTAQGVLMQNLGWGKHMNTLHWNMEDGSIVDWHNHSAEQFGYVIKGGFKIFYDDGKIQENYEIHEGDCYFIPPNILHKFIALGETEAIDVFNPIKVDIPKEIQ